MARNGGEPSSFESLIPDLTSINDEINKISDTIDSHFASVAASINDALRNTSWLPDSIKPPQKSIPHAVRPVVLAAPLGYLAYSKDWISRHRALTAAIVAFVGTGTCVIIWQRRKRRSHNAKRHARRAKNGSRTEIVVLAGSPHSPLTRSLALDLERRRFIVYIPVTDLSEEQLVQSESRVDIRPLNLDLTSPTSTADSLSKLSSLLSRSHHPLPHTPPHTLHLTSLILLPPSPPPASHISHLPPETWDDTLTSHLLAPFTTLNAFLPLLITHTSSLLILSPAIIPPLNPASHALENVTAAAWGAYIATLRQETSTLDLNIVHFKLGLFDYGPTSRALVPTSLRTPSVTSSSGEEASPQREESARARYAREDAAAAIRGKKSLVRGSPLRDLHVAVFDAMVGGLGRGGTVFVGKGSRAYDFVGRWVPGGVVGWMLRGRGGGGLGGGGLGYGGHGRGEESAEWEKVEGGAY